MLLRALKLAKEANPDVCFSALSCRPKIGRAGVVKSIALAAADLFWVPKMCKDGEDIFDALELGSFGNS